MHTDAPHTEEQALAGEPDRAPAYVRQLGLNGRPFRPSRHDFLFDHSRSMQDALQTLLQKCWDGEQVVLANVENPRLQACLSEALAERLGEDFEVVILQADLLMGEDELLYRLAEALFGDPALSGASVEQVQEAIQAELEQISADGLDLLIQIEHAQELGAQVLDTLLPLLQSGAQARSAQLLLWGDFQPGEGPGDDIPRLGIEADPVPVPSFTRADIRAYLAYCLQQSGYLQRLPFSENQLDHIIQQSGGVPAEVDRLAEAELEKVKGKRFSFPVLHTITGCALLGILILLYTSSRDRSPDPSEQANSTPIRALDAPPPREAVAGAGTIQRQEAQQQGQQEQQETAAQPAAPPQGVEPAAEPAPAPAPPAVAGTRAGQTTAAPAAAQAPSAAARPAASAQQPAASDSPKTPLALHHETLRALPPEHFALQLMGSFSEQNARDFIAAHNLADSFYLQTRFQNKPWFVVVHGNFPTREAAQSALAELPEQVRASSPWIRTLKDITQSIQGPPSLD